MSRDSGTRSGLLWEVERILLECKELEKKGKGGMPDVLLLENVPQLVSEKNMEDFKEWMLQLERIGYSNYWQILNAKDYGIPQNRQRVFMVSFYGEYTYSFPKKQELKLRLKDMLQDNPISKHYYLSKDMINYVSCRGRGGFLNKDSKINLDIARPLTTEQNKRAGTTNYISEDFPDNFDLSTIYPYYPVDEKYYLSDAMIEYCCGTNQKESKFPRGERFIQSVEQTNHNDIANCISTNAGNRPVDNFIADDECIDKLTQKVNKKTLVGGEKTIKIKNATKKGYSEAKVGDGVDVSTRMETHRGTVQDGMSLTIKTQCDVGVVVDE